jgi:hypothetical protein
MRTRLSVTVRRVDDDHLELSIGAANDRFAGEADVYVPPGLPAEWAARLMGFPAGPDDARDFVAGTFRDDEAGGGASLRFRAADRAGHAVVAVLLRSGAGVAAEARESAIFTVAVEAASVDRFVRGLARLTVVGDCAELA